MMISLFCILIIPTSNLTTFALLFTSTVCLKTQKVLVAISHLNHLKNRVMDKINIYSITSNINVNDASLFYS